MMLRVHGLTLCGLLTVCLIFCLRGRSLSAEEGRRLTEKSPATVDFNRHIRPLLAKYCFACHGPDEKNREASLRLDVRSAAIAKLESGQRAIVPGKPQQSELIRRLTAKDEAERMPPPETKKKVSAEEIALLKRWIQAGAPYARHWAFIKPKRPAVPAVSGSPWPRNPIDRFILSRLQREGLQPSPPADRYTLLRRLSFDLRGIPPSVQEIRAFLKDRRPDAYEKVVDRFLHDPRYGERWARVWLDLARYADSRGYGSDPLRPNIWRYRDWVIDAFNRNLPYDQFTIEQLAGDLLPSPTLEQKIATAFHRNTMTNTEGGTDDEEFRVAAVRDRVDTTVQVWMGLTMGCAKCHSHKYDPITQTEYYRFYAYFNQTADADRPDEAPVIPAPRREDLEALQRFEAQVAALKKRIAAADAKERPALQKELARLQKTRPKLPTVPVMQELPPEKRRTTYVMIRGNFLARGETVSPGTPQAFHPFPAKAPHNRLGVALWLMHPDNPLTARVAVNRFWARIFGIGIVETEEDFGTQGELPSHPELLDWLAVEFRESGWDIKRLLKLIVTSATYRQSSRQRPELLTKDPRNRLLARFPRVRLEAEMVRDQALALSGLLSQKMKGPSVYPPQPPGLWRAAFNGQRKWPTSRGEDRYRRGLYTFWRRTVPYPSMAVFDAPSRELCTVRRIRTNTPLQAFVTLNDPAYVEAAQALARRILQEGGSSTESRLRYALLLCTSRPATPAQIAALTKLHQQVAAHYRKDKAAAKTIAVSPLHPLPKKTDTAELAAWTVIANVLLNMDAVLTRP